MRLRGLAASSKAIERGVSLPTPEELMMLEIALSETVFRLARLRLADGVPMAIERAAVPMRFLGHADLGRPVADAALEALARSPGARGAAAEGGGDRPGQAALLEMAEGLPGLDIQRVAYTAWAPGRIHLFDTPLRYRRFRGGTDAAADRAAVRRRRRCHDRDLHGGRNRRNR